MTSHKDTSLQIVDAQNHGLLVRRPPSRCNPLTYALSIWAVIATVGCGLALGYFAERPEFAPWNAKTWWESNHPWTTVGFDAEPVVVVIRPGLSTPSFQRHDARYTVSSNDTHRQLQVKGASHIKAAGVTHLLEDGKTKYEIHSEVTAAHMYGEYVEASGAVSKNTFRLRIKELATGHQAVLTPFGLHMPSLLNKSASLVPNFFHFSYKENGKPQSVSTFVSSAYGEHRFHYGQGENEWNQFMNPFLTTYWAAMTKDYKLKAGPRSNRRLSEGGSSWEDDVASAADTAIDWGEGQVNHWVGSEAGQVGGDIGEAVGSKVGGYIGEAAGAALGGPAGAAIGAEIGSWAGGEAGEYFGNKYGSELGSEAASGVTSEVGDSLKSSINSWASNADSSGGGGYMYG